MLSGHHHGHTVGMKKAGNNGPTPVSAISLQQRPMLAVIEWPASLMAENVS